MINGVINLDNKSYPFFLRGNSLVLPCDTENKSKIMGELKNLDREEFKSIRGRTTTNHEVIFFNGYLYTEYLLSYWNEIIIVINGYVLNSSNCYLGETTSDFNLLRFTGKIIDTFYTSNRCIKREKSRDAWEFNSVKETFSFKYNNIVVSASIRTSVKDESLENHTEIQTFSYLDLEFSEMLNIDKIIEVVKDIQDVFEFLNFQAHLHFEGVGLLNTHHERVGWKLHLFEEISECHNETFTSITFKDIPIDKIGDLFTEIIDKKKSGKLHKTYLPLERRQGLNLDITKYLFTALTFESEFNLYHPNFKCETNKVFKNAKQDVLESIEKLKIDYIQKNNAGKNNKYCKVLSEFVNACMFIDGSLEYKYNESLKLYSLAIKSVKEKFQIKEEFNKGALFANTRNGIGHGKISKNRKIITRDILCLYIWTIALTYAMPLRKIGLSDEEIDKIVIKFFNTIYLTI